MAYKEWVKMIISRFEIVYNCSFCAFCQVDNSDFGTLTADDEFHGIEIDTVTVEICEFRDTQSS